MGRAGEAGTPARRSPKGWLTRRREAGAKHPNDDAVTSLQVAIIFTIFLPLIFVIFQAGIYYHARQWAGAAADRAVAQASQLGATSDDGVDEVATFLGGSFCNPVGSGSDASTVSVSRDDAAGTVSATVTCRVPTPLVPWAASATAAGPIERFVPENERT